jgi:hypothetical protein
LLAVTHAARHYGGMDVAQGPRRWQVTLGRLLGLVVVVSIAFGVFATAVYAGEWFLIFEIPVLGAAVGTIRDGSRGALYMMLISLYVCATIVLATMLFPDAINRLVMRLFN